MYANTKAQLFDALFDATTGIKYSQNRMITRETEDGNVSLIAYGWLKIAEFTESKDAVTVFTGHRALNSQTLSRYLNDVVSHAEDSNVDVIISGESPAVDTPNEGVKYIKNYVSMSGNRSPVEEEAVDEVVESLRDIDEE